MFKSSRIFLTCDLFGLFLQVFESRKAVKDLTLLPMNR